jgi:hypothetical protein
VPVEKETLMLSGVRKSAARVREEEYDDKTEAKAATSKAAESLQLKTNSKEPLR